MPAKPWCKVQKLIKGLNDKHRKLENWAGECHRHTPVWFRLSITENRSITETQKRDSSIGWTSPRSPSRSESERTPQSHQKYGQSASRCRRFSTLTKLMISLLRYSDKFRRETPGTKAPEYMASCDVQGEAITKILLVRREEYGKHLPRAWCFGWRRLVNACQRRIWQDQCFSYHRFSRGQAANFQAHWLGTRNHMPSKLPRKKRKQTFYPKLAKREEKTLAQVVRRSSARHREHTQCFHEGGSRGWPREKQHGHHLSCLPNLEEPSPTENEEETDDQTSSMDSHELQCEKGYWSDLRADTGTLFLSGQDRDGTTQFDTFFRVNPGARRQRAPDSKSQLVSWPMTKIQRRCRRCGLQELTISGRRSTVMELWMSQSFWWTDHSHNKFSQHDGYHEKAQVFCWWQDAQPTLSTQEILGVGRRRMGKRLQTARPTRAGVSDEVAQEFQVISNGNTNIEGSHRWTIQNEISDPDEYAKAANADSYQQQRSKLTNLLGRSVSRVDTKNNRADLFTKHLDGLRTRAVAKKLGLHFLDMAGWLMVVYERESPMMTTGQLLTSVCSWAEVQVLSVLTCGQIVHYIDIDICTLTQSLPCCCLPCFFSSSAYPQTDTAQLYNTHPDVRTHMDRTGLEFNLSFCVFATQEQFTLSSWYHTWWRTSPSRLPVYRNHKIYRDATGLWTITERHGERICRELRWQMQSINDDGYG